MSVFWIKISHCNFEQIVISIFLIENPVYKFFKVFGVQNQLPITFCSDLVCNRH